MEYKHRQSSFILLGYKYRLFLSVFPDLALLPDFAVFVDFEDLSPLGGGSDLGDFSDLSSGIFSDFELFDGESSLLVFFEAL